MNEQQLQALQSAVHRYAVTKEYLATLLSEYGYQLFTVSGIQEDGTKEELTTLAVHPDYAQAIDQYDLHANTWSDTVDDVPQYAVYRLGPTL
jgi:hypothetical protein